MHQPNILPMGSLQKIKREKLGTFAKQGGRGSDLVDQMSPTSLFVPFLKVSTPQNKVSQLERGRGGQQRFG